MTNPALKKSILVVEDDIAISNSLREFLEDNGYRVAVARNGKEALEVLDTDPSPSLILLDLMMPIMDGFKFRELQLAKENAKNIPVIIMSADGHVEQKKNATAATEYLRKPFDIFHLLATVKRHMGEVSE